MEKVRFVSDSIPIFALWKITLYGTYTLETVMVL